MESLDNCTDAPETIIGSTGVLCWFDLLWVHCTGECNLPIIGSTGDSKLSLFWSFRLGFLGVLYLFIPWTYKPDNDHLNAHFSPSVVCVINRQNHMMETWHEAIFFTISPFLVIDEDTTKASKQCNNMNWYKLKNNLIPIGKIILTLEPLSLLGCHGVLVLKCV